MKSSFATLNAIPLAISFRLSSRNTSRIPRRGMTAAICWFCITRPMAILRSLIPDTLALVAGITAPHLPVYSWVQGVVPYPLDLLIYITGFTAAAYLMLLIGMGVRAIGRLFTRKRAPARV